MTADSIILAALTNQGHNAVPSKGPSRTMSYVPKRPTKPREPPSAKPHPPPDSQTSSSGPARRSCKEVLDCTVGDTFTEDDLVLQGSFVKRGNATALSHCAEPEDLVHFQISSDDVPPTQAEQKAPSRRSSASVARTTVTRPATTAYPATAGYRTGSATSRGSRTNTPGNGIGVHRPGAAVLRAGLIGLTSSSTGGALNARARPTTAPAERSSTAPRPRPSYSISGTNNRGIRGGGGRLVSQEERDVYNQKHKMTPTGRPATAKVRGGLHGVTANTCKGQASQQPVSKRLGEIRADVRCGSPQRPSSRPVAPTTAPTDRAGRVDQLAAFIMNAADCHNRNEQLSVNEMRTFLGQHPFTNWLTRSNQNMLKHDTNRDGCFSFCELQGAVSNWLNTQGDMPEVVAAINMHKTAAYAAPVTAHSKPMLEQVAAPAASAAAHKEPQVVSRAQTNSSVTVAADQSEPSFAKPSPAITSTTRLSTTTISTKSTGSSPLIAVSGQAVEHAATQTTDEPRAEPNEQSNDGMQKRAEQLALGHNNRQLQKQVEEQAKEIAELKEQAAKDKKALELSKSGKLSRYSYSKKDYETVDITHSRRMSVHLTKNEAEQLAHENSELKQQVQTLQNQLEQLQAVAAPTEPRRAGSQLWQKATVGLKMKALIQMQQVLEAQRDKVDHEISARSDLLLERQQDSKAEWADSSAEHQMLHKGALAQETLRLNDRLELASQRIAGSQVFQRKHMHAQRKFQATAHAIETLTQLCEENGDQIETKMKQAESALHKAKTAAEAVKRRSTGAILSVAKAQWAKAKGAAKWLHICHEAQDQAGILKAEADKKLELRELELKVAESAHSATLEVQQSLTKARADVQLLRALSSTGARSKLKKQEVLDDLLQDAKKENRIAKLEMEATSHQANRAAQAADTMHGAQGALVFAVRVEPPEETKQMMENNSAEKVIQDRLLKCAQDALADAEQCVQRTSSAVKAAMSLCNSTDTSDKHQQRAKMATEAAEQAESAAVQQLKGEFEAHINADERTKKVRKLLHKKMLLHDQEGATSPKMAKLNEKLKEAYLQQAKALAASKEKHTARLKLEQARGSLEGIQAYKAGRMQNESRCAPRTIARLQRAASVAEAHQEECAETVDTLENTLQKIELEKVEELKLAVEAAAVANQEGESAVAKQLPERATATQEGESDTIENKTAAVQEWVESKMHEAQAAEINAAKSRHDMGSLDVKRSLWYRTGERKAIARFEDSTSRFEKSKLVLETRNESEAMAMMEAFNASLNQMQLDLEEEFQQVSAQAMAYEGPLKEGSSDADSGIGDSSDDKTQESSSGSSDVQKWFEKVKGSTVSMAIKMTAGGRTSRRAARARCKWGKAMGTWNMVESIHEQAEAGQLPIDAQVAHKWLSPEKKERFQKKKDLALFKLTNAEEQERLATEAVKSVEVIQGQLSVVNQMKQDLESLLGGGDFEKWKSQNVNSDDAALNLLMRTRCQAMSMSTRASEQAQSDSTIAEQAKRNEADFQSATVVMACKLQTAKLALKLQQLSEESGCTTAASQSSPPLPNSPKPSVQRTGSILEGTHIEVGHSLAVHTAEQQVGQSRRAQLEGASEAVGKLASTQNTESIAAMVHQARAAHVAATNALEKALAEAPGDVEGEAEEAELECEKNRRLLLWASGTPEEILEFRQNYETSQSRWKTAEMRLATITALREEVDKTAGALWTVEGMEGAEHVDMDRREDALASAWLSALRSKSFEKDVGPDALSKDTPRSHPQVPKLALPSQPGNNTRTVQVDVGGRSHTLDLKSSEFMADLQTFGLGHSD